MQTPSNEAKYAMPVMTPQVSVLVLPSPGDPQELKKRNEGQVGVAAIDEDTRKDWDVPFFDCCSNIVPNCCMSTVCPCVAIAQIQARLGNSYSNALLSYGSAIFGLMVCIILFISHSATTDEVKTSDGSDTGEVRSSTGREIIFLCGAMFFLSIYSFSVCVVRMRVREQFEIDGSCGQDCIVSTCCTPCTVAQMASQTQSYTPGVLSFASPNIDTIPGYPGTPPVQFI